MFFYYTPQCCTLEPALNQCPGRERLAGRRWITAVQVSALLPIPKRKMLFRFSNTTRMSLVPALWNVEWTVYYIDPYTFENTNSHGSRSAGCLHRLGWKEARQDFRVGG